MRSALIRATIVAVAIALAGLFVGVGFARGRAADRFVTVKGVSEREVQADLAIWPLHVVAADNDLAAANQQIQQSVQRLRDFLTRQGIDTTQLTLQDFAVNDANVNQYNNGNVTARYVIRQTVVVRSTHPEEVLRASQNVAELVSAGVVLVSGNEYGGGGGPTFLFTKLHEVKAPMIAEATARAREAAEQFARDSKAEIGGIRRANQGVFEILPRDQAPGISQESQVAKTVRVVSTIDYALK